MKANKEHLYVFGFGLSLIIPFIIMMHTMKEGLGFSEFITKFLIGLILLMIVSAKTARIRPIFNMWILGPQVITLDYCSQSGVGLLGFAFLVLSTFFLLATIFKVESLVPIYQIWMKIAHRIGTIITTILMMIIFYGVFTPVAIFFRIVRKDFLDRSLEPSRESYWNIREEQEFEKQKYTRQF